VKRHKQLWGKVASLDNLKEAAVDALRGKRGKRAGAIFFQRWETEVVRLARELEDGSYRPHYFPSIDQGLLREKIARVVGDRRVIELVDRILESYVDDFLLFGENASELRRLGARCREFLDAERLEIHPDKYRLIPSAHGVDFCGYVVRADGRVRVRNSNARRFRKRYERMRWEVAQGRCEIEDLTATVRAWIAHAEHAQSWRLRLSVLGR